MVREDIHTTEYEESGAFRRLSWGSIFSGLFVALTIFILLNLLGAGIGISTLDIQDTADNPRASTLGIAAGIWWFIVGLISLYVGGWVAGYLANSYEKTSTAIHGVVVWSLMYLIMFLLVTTAFGTVVGGTIGAIGRSAQNQQITQRLSQAMGQAGFNQQNLEQAAQDPAKQAQAQQTAQTAVKVSGGSLIGLAIAMLIGGIVAALGAISGSPRYYHPHIEHREHPYTTPAPA